MESALVAGRAHVGCVCLLHDGSVTILSPPVPPSQPPAPQQQLHYGVPAEAIACCSQGTLLAVASRVALHVYVLADCSGTADGARAILCWSAPLNAHVKGLAISSCAPGASAVVAVAGAPGLCLMAGDGAEPARRWTLHAGRMICSCTFSGDGRLLALATLDGSLYLHAAPPRGSAPQRWAEQPALWAAALPLERACCLDFSACARWLAVRGWGGDTAVYDCALGAPAAAARAAAPDDGRGADAADAADAAWRLAALRLARPAQPSGPALLRWCGAAHAASTLLAAEPAEAEPAGATDGASRPRGAAGGAAPRHRLQLRGARGGAPRGAALAVAEVRGLCGGRCADADGRAVEVALWLDGPRALGWRALWGWEDAEAGGGDGGGSPPATAAAQLAIRVGSTDWPVTT